MAVHGLHVPLDGLEACPRVLALGLVRHRIERHVVRVVDEDEIAELLVAREFDRLHADALLHATVTREADDVVVEQLVLGGVETCLRHQAGDGHAHGIANALAERAGGRLDAGRVVKFRVAGRLRMQLAKRLDVIDGKLEAHQVQPSVKEHGAMTGGEDEAIAVEPARAFGIERERVPEEHGADLGAAEREAKMADAGLVHGINGEAAGLRGGLGENGRLERHGKVKSKWGVIVFKPGLSF